MHDLLLELGADEHLTLALLPLDGGALVAAFAPSPARLPRWIAKTAHGPAACRRLRAEAQALRDLAPLAAALHIPEVLAWQDSEPGDGRVDSTEAISRPRIGVPPRSHSVTGEKLWPDGPLGRSLRGRGGADLREGKRAGGSLYGAEPPAKAGRDWPGEDACACLVQTPIPGAPRPAPTVAVCDWLRRWQAMAPQHLRPRPLPSLAALAASTLAEAQGLASRSPESAPLLSWVGALLAPPPPATSACWTHGDFWSGNILWTPARRWPRRAAFLGVVDWSGLGPGSALDDLLNWIIHWPGTGPWPVWLLAGGRPRQLLRDWARHAGYSAPVARFAFYLFLARRLLWELGFALQARSAGEQAQARAHWAPVLAALAQRGYPDPF